MEQHLNESKKEPVRDVIGNSYVFNPNIAPQAVIAQYRDQALGYDERMRQWQFLTPRQSTEILERFIPKDTQILEAGCGTGLSGEAHHAAGYKNLHGFDISQEMLDIARSKGIYRSLSQGDLLSPLPFSDGQFGAVECVAVLTHIEDASETFAEFCRIVKPGGHIIFSQRKDLWDSRGMSRIIGRLEDQEIAECIHDSGWLPYVLNQEDYVKAGIQVGYFVLKKK